MQYRYALAEHGRTLATRPLGRQLRVDLLQKASGADVVALDFSDILSTSQSFADEFVARLVEDASAGHLDCEIELCGTAPNVERVVLKALERRGLQAPALV